MKKIISLVLVLLCVTLASCDKETEGISKKTVYPVLTMSDKTFVNVVMQPDGEFKDPGISAELDGEDWPVEVIGKVDITKSGLYSLVYNTYSRDGFKVSAGRTVLVTPKLIDRDLSGTYSMLDTKYPTDAKVKLVTGDLGYYRISDSWFQNTASPLTFVDLGGEELIVLSTSTPYGPISNVGGKFDPTTGNLNFFYVVQGRDVNFVWKKQ